MFLFSTFNYFAELLTAGSSDPQESYFKTFFFLFELFCQLRISYMYVMQFAEIHPHSCLLFSNRLGLPVRAWTTEDNRIPLPLKLSSANSSLAGGGGGDFPSPSQSRLGFWLALCVQSQPL